MKTSKLKHLPNALTLSNMAIGVFIIFLMIKNHSVSSLRLACCLIYIAVVFDMLDGYLARYLNSSSELGKQLDSFADFSSFVLAPVAIFISSMNYVPWYIMVIVLFYPLAGGLRLARYNLQKNCEHFFGLPTTAAGLISSTVLLVNSFLSSQFTVGFIVFYLLLVVVLSIMMISNFRVNRILKYKDSGNR